MTGIASITDWVIRRRSEGSRWRSGSSLRVLLEVLQRLVEIGRHVNLAGGATGLARPRISLGLLDLGQWPPLIHDQDFLARLKMLDELIKVSLGFLQGNAAVGLYPRKGRNTTIWSLISSSGMYAATRRMSSMAEPMDYSLVVTMRPGIRCPSATRWYAKPTIVFRSLVIRTRSSAAAFWCCANVPSPRTGQSQISPGQRPGERHLRIMSALKGRHKLRGVMSWQRHCKRFVSPLTGLRSARKRVPRALPWASLFRPRRGELQYSATSKAAAQAADDPSVHICVTG